METLTYSQIANCSRWMIPTFDRAFGKNGLGAMEVTNVAGLDRLRQILYQNFLRVVDLPQDEKDDLSHPESKWNLGFSIGKENLGNGFDLSKASFYFTGSNESIWPTSIPELKDNCMELCGMVENIVKGVCQHLELLTGYSIQNIRNIKGRLLYYYPGCDVEYWNSPHVDSGYITILLPDIYVDHETRMVIESTGNEGLYIQTPEDNLKIRTHGSSVIVQVGEGLQIQTGGKLVATPHCVKSSDHKTMARVACAIFIDVDQDEKMLMPENCTMEEIFCNQKFQSNLEKRWYNGISYANYCYNTFQKYYPET